MQDRQMQAGMDWVEARLSGLAEGQEVTIKPRGWETDTINFAAARRHFVVLLNGQRQVVTFEDVDLEDVPSDPRLQIMVEGDLRAFLNDQLRGSDLAG